MKLGYYFILLIFCTAKINAQNSDVSFWKDVLSGNVSAYKKHRIASVKLFKNDVVLNEINYNFRENSVEITDKNQPSKYTFDVLGRILEFKTNNAVYQFKFNENEISNYNIEVENDSVFTTRKSEKIDSEKLKKETFQYQERNKKNNIITYNHISTKIKIPNDSINSYEETRINKNYYRRYLNKDWVRKEYFNDKDYDYDSISTRKTGEKYTMYERMRNDSLLRNIHTKDSMLNSYFTKGKLYLHESGNLKNITKKEFYNPETGKKIRTLYHTFYPRKKDSMETLWKMVETNYLENKTKEYYNNQRYRLKNGFLHQKMSWSVWRKIRNTLGFKDKVSYGSCGMTEKRTYISFQHAFASTSVLFPKNFFWQIDEETIVSELSYDLVQGYFHTDIPISDLSQIKTSGFYTENTDSKEINRELRRVAKRNLSKEKMKDWVVEITTTDGKKQTCKPEELIDNLTFGVDMFLYNDKIRENENL